MILMTQPPAKRHLAGVRNRIFLEKEREQEEGARPVSSLGYPVQSARYGTDAGESRILDELRTFFQGLCTDLLAAYRSRADIDLIVKQAGQLRTRLTERNLLNFERLFETAPWDYNIEEDNEVWTYADDRFYDLNRSYPRGNPGL